MRSELLSQEKNFVTIKAEFDAKEFQESVNKAVRELSQKMNVPGFRRGRVPRNILEMRLGKEGIYAEALESLIPEAIDQIVQDYDLDLIAEPELNVDKIEEGSNVSITLKFEVTPEVELPNLEEIEIEKLKVNVTDAMVEESIKTMRKQNAELETVQRPAKQSDVVTIGYITSVLGAEGNVEKSHEEADANVDLELNELRIEIKDALIGCETGEKVSATVKVEEDYSDKSIAGKEVRYDMTIKEIKEKKEPELNEAFFEKMLGESVADEATFRREVRKHLENRLIQESDTMAENMAIAKVSETAKVELPETLIRRQMEGTKKKDAEEAQKRFQKSMSDVLQASGMSPEEYEEKIRKQAEVVVLQYLVLDALARDFDISVEKSDFEEELAPLATAYKLSTDNLLRAVFKDQNRIMEMGNRIRYRKTVKELLNRVIVRDVEKLSPTEEEGQAE